MSSPLETNNKTECCISRALFAGQCNKQTNTELVKMAMSKRLIAPLIIYMLK